MSLPVLGILPDKRQVGIYNLSDPAPPLVKMPFWAALKTHWITDAHFVQYTLAGSDTPHPRCNKAVLNKIRAAGHDLTATCLVLDYDNPAHGAWTREMMTAFIEQLELIAEQWPTAWNWTCLYSTRGGARFVYVLDRPIPVDEAELKHQWLCQQFLAAGIAVDAKVSDWTRVFRLPFVSRDGKNTWEDELQFFYEQPAAVLKVDDLGNASRSMSQQNYGIIEQITDPKPSTFDAQDLCYAVNMQSGRRGMSQWFKTARTRLKGRECYRCLFEGIPIADYGSRDNTLHGYVGQAISLLMPVQGTTPQHIYGLFLEPVLKLEPDSNTRDWTDVLWSTVCRLWAKEAAKVKAAQAEQEAITQATNGQMASIVNGMREWCDSPFLANDDETCLAWVMRHLIVSVGQSYAVMLPSGRYDSLLVSSTQLVPRIRALGMDRIIQTDKLTKDGGYMPKPLKDVVDEYATIANTARAVPEMRGSVLERIDTHNAMLVLPSYRRNPALTPEYDEDVDHWLTCFFGPHYEIGCQWIAWALAFEEGPICALSLKAGEGIGKKMFTVGLSECLEVPALASEQDITGSYQYGLMNSPFLVVNEGWPTRVMGKHPADAFRELVSGDPISANRKYMAPVSVKTPMRIIFTANNHDVVQMLTANRNLSPEDRRALQIRLLHMDLNNDANQFLRDRGGMKFTGVAGRRWVAGDGNQPSDYVVAKHFLWLHANRQKAPGTRFLVEGAPNETIMHDMRTRSGDSPLVIEALVQLLECPRALDGLHIVDDRVFCLTAQVLQHFRQNMASGTRENLTAQKIAAVFRSLCVQEFDKAFVLPGREAQGEKRWHELDPEILLTVAQRDGWKCAKLEAIVRSRRLSLKRSLPSVPA